MVLIMLVLSVVLTVLNSMNRTNSMNETPIVLRVCIVLKVYIVLTVWTTVRVVMYKQRLAHCSALRRYHNLAYCWVVLLLKVKKETSTYFQKSFCTVIGPVFFGVENLWLFRPLDVSILVMLATERNIFRIFFFMKAIWRALCLGGGGGIIAKS